jgi:hypothetical protein
MALSLPDRLTRALKGRSVIPFVGAGLSKRVDPARFPSWRELLVSLANVGEARGYVTNDQNLEIVDLLNNNMYPYAAEQLRRRIPGEEFNFFLEEQFRCDSRKFNLEDQMALLKIEPPMIVTTNFDRLIEDAFARHYLRAPSVCTYAEAVRAHNRLQRTRSTQNPLIFKIHGDIDDVSSIILGERDFKRLMFDERTFETVLINTLISYTILFVGYGLRDPEITYHLERNHNILKRSSDPDYIIIPSNSVKQIEMQRWREEYNVEAIPYNVSTVSNTDLSDVLNSLEGYL